MDRIRSLPTVFCSTLWGSIQELSPKLDILDACTSLQNARKAGCVLGASCAQQVFLHHERSYNKNSAQGNCSAKSFAASVMLSILPCSSILPCPPCLPPIMLCVGGGVLPPVCVCVCGGGSASSGGGGGGSHREGVLWGEGAGDISVQLPYTALPHGASP